MTVKIEDIKSFCASQILGDGSIRSKYSLEIRHEQQWADYLVWKQQIAVSLGLDVSSIRFWEEQSNISYQKRASICVRTPYELIKNESPVNLIKALNPLGLLLWWLDDGCLVVHKKRNGSSVSRFGYLGTENYNEHTNKLISIALYERFNLLTAIHIDRGSISNRDAIYYRLYFNATSMRQFIDIVRPFIPFVPDSLIYKLNMGYIPNRLANSFENSLRYNF